VKKLAKHEGLRPSPAWRCVGRRGPDRIDAAAQLHRAHASGRRSLPLLGHASSGTGATPFSLLPPTGVRLLSEATNRTTVAHDCGCWDGTPRLNRSADVPTSRGTMVDLEAAVIDRLSLVRIPLWPGVLGDSIARRRRYVCGLQPFSRHRYQQLTRGKTRRRGTTSDWRSALDRKSPDSPREAAPDPAWKSRS
jgi:hypothetical protein